MSAIRVALAKLHHANPFAGRLPSRPARHARRRPVRYVPALEGLEARRLLSFNFFGNVGTPTAPMTVGPDGNLWFFNGTVATGPEISKFSLDGTITTYHLPTRPDLGFPGLTAGPDGNVWFTESRGLLNSPSLIGRITPDGTVTEFSNLRVNSFVFGIAAGADGNLWFTTTNHTGDPLDEVERITPDGTVTEFPNAPGNGAIAAGPDGNIWFATDRGQIGRITPDGSVTTFSFPGADILGLTVGSDGNLWALTGFAPINDFGSVVRITPDGATTRFPLPDQQGPGDVSFNNCITLGPDGNVWFPDRGKLDQITPGGTITEFHTPDNQFGAALVTGPDGNLWSLGFNQVGQFVFDGITTTPTTTLLSAPVTAIAGQPVTLTATVTSSAGVPGGPVFFVDNGTLLGSADLDGSGLATFTASFDVGFHAVSAFYAGTPDFAPSGDIRGIQVSDSGDGAPVTFDNLTISASQEVVGVLVPTAVDTHFATTHREGATDTATDHRPAGAAGDATVIARQRETVYTAPAPQTTAEVVITAHHQRDGLEATDAAGLADSLAADAW